MVADTGFDPEPLLRGLNAHGVAYVVVGGFAVAAHGVIRATADLDLVVERSWANAGRLANALSELGAEGVTGEAPSLSAQALVRRADRRFRTPHGDLHLLYELEGVPDYRALLPAEQIQLGTELVPVTTLDRLRAMKRAVGRPKDAFDLAELEALHGPEDQARH